MSSPLASRARQYVDLLTSRPNTFGAPALLTAEEARTTCSTFLGLLLRESFNEAPKKHMRAREWFSFFADVAPTLKIGDVAAGSVGLMAYDKDRSGMSGHCFVVVDVPVQSGSHGGATTWAVGVVDSCRSHHGLADTRQDAPGGIGHGVMELIADHQGVVKGYRWSLSAASEYMHNGEGQHISLFGVPTTWTTKGKPHG